MNATTAKGLTIILILGLSAPLWAQSAGKGGQTSAVDFSNVADCVGPPSAGEPILCSCPEGAPAGSVWGSGPYTADSDICTAARHAGIVTEAGGAVQLMHRPGQDSYAGSDANGVTTRDWGAYGESFDVLAVAAQTPPTGAMADAPVCSVLPTGSETLTCSCTSGISGSVWGSGPYTSDSNICSAARHAGVIGSEGGVVTVIRAPGLDAYSGTSANGETTGNWAAYDSSIVFNRN